MIPNWLQRTEMLLGPDAIIKLQKTHILLVGLGGVGSWVAEFLVRTGIGHLTIVDSDKVEESNINRQLPATHQTIGMPKTDVMKERLQCINPNLQLTVIEKYINEESINDILSGDYDLIIDAIDTLSPKIWFLFFALQKGFPIISSMGSGARLDPTQVEIADISKTRNCTLARMVRKRLGRMGVRKGFTAVFSTELPQKSAVIETEGRNKKSTIGTVVFVPVAFASAIASKAVDVILNEK